jgi:uncharacterized protein with PIN domain
MFVDASALTAILTGEPDARELLGRLHVGVSRKTSRMAVWETVMAVSRQRKMDVQAGEMVVEAFLKDFGVEVLPIPAEARHAAIEAHARFGKGRHPAALNFGDCFAYACARHAGGPLLYKVRFPSTMVDRIVPATTDADRASVAAALGLEDAWPIVTEPFTQWVVEDDFGLGRPAWEKVGVEFVADVAPYELMKLRMLNGSHSTLSYLGYLMGHETVASAMGEPALARLVSDLMEKESAPTLPTLSVDLAAYRADLLARFRNPALKHRTWQIAMDGSQKLPQRLLGTIRDRLAVGAPIDRAALGVAAWMRYVTGVDEKGGAIDVRDPLAARLRAIADAAGPDAARLAPALAAVGEVFGADLPADPRFMDAVTAGLDRLLRLGARATVEAMVEETAG